MKHPTLIARAFGLIICLAAISAVSLGQPLKDSKGRPLMVGLQLYSVRDDCAKDLPGVLKAVANMGYTGVEFAGYHGRRAQELRQLLDENHLKCYGTHIGLDTLLGDNFEKTIEFNKVLGNKFLCVPWISEEKRSSREAWLATAKQFSEIAKKLEPYGMILGYHDHNVDFKVIDGETGFDTFFKNTDKRVAIQFDTGNALEAGVQAAPYIARYPGRVLSVHVKDFSSSNPKALLGEGEEHWNEVLPLLRGPAGTRWFIIEQEDYPSTPLEAVEKCLRNFEKMWNGKAIASRQ